MHRYGYAQIVSVVAITMGGFRISPEELIGEPAPEKEDDLSPEERFVAHIARIEERERKQQADWFAALGLAPPQDR